MLLTLMMLAAFGPMPEETNPLLQPLAVALRPEDIEVPPPQEVDKGGPSYPRKHSWPSPHRRFTRKG
jgi:hypothetical protein